MNTQKPPDTLRGRLRLKSIQWLIMQRERELLLSEAKAHSFTAESCLLQEIPVHERPHSYEGDLLYTNEQLAYFRENLAIARERYIESRHMLHELLAELFDEPEINAQCLELIELPIPVLYTISDFKTQQDICSWLRQIEEQVTLSFESIVCRKIDMLIGL
ncbi:MAG TPA: hypothetical protein VJ841_01090 [Candidatus Saccharimonadales bacterium]|nr:hypothetical protein [Candidatus Saccharimonadales bacterium]